MSGSLTVVLPGAAWNRSVGARRAASRAKTCWRRSLGPRVSVAGIDARRRLMGKRVFLTWTACNPLKSHEPDERIQENPSPFSWSGLDWLGFGLEEFGLRRYAVGRSLRAPLNAWTKPAARDGARSTGRVTFAGKWHRKGLKRLFLRRETVWPRQVEATTSGARGTIFRHPLTGGGRVSRRRQPAVSSPNAGSPPERRYVARSPNPLLRATRITRRRQTQKELS